MFATRVRVVRCARARVKRFLDQCVNLENELLTCEGDCQHNAQMAAPSKTAVDSSQKRDDEMRIEEVVDLGCNNNRGWKAKGVSLTKRTRC